MNEQIARGLPPIDDEYRGPSWWDLSRLVDVTHRPGMRRIALIGLSVNLVAVATGIMQAIWGWGGLPLRLGPFQLAVTVYPPFILSLLAAVWIGPAWGLVPAYAANLAAALVSGLDPVPAILFAFAGAVEILIFWGAMVTLNIDPDMKRRQDLVRFVGASIIAPTTASLAVLIRTSAQGLSLAESREVWLGWVVGDAVQALLVVVPLLYLTGPKVRSWIDRQFATPPRYEVTYTRAAIIAATTFALVAMLTFIGIYMLEGSLDLDPGTLTRSGEPLLPHLREMELFVALLVVVLTLTTGVFSTVLGRMGERQRSLSRRESLTGCFNRRAFYELFPREAERARRLRQGISLVFLDIDHFKRINDRFGHEFGDRVLQQLAGRLQGTVRETDLLFRWGGEEFVILLGHTAASDAPTLAERIRAAVEARPFLDGNVAGPLRVTVSVGTAGTSEYPVDPDALVARADAACYRAKEGGRNRVEADAPVVA
jgi:diguanylate cyclase